MFVGVGGSVSGLDWNGNPAGQRAIIFSNPNGNGLPAYPATYIWKVFQRNQVTSGTFYDGTRYYTTFFWGIDGTFTGAGNEYYGAHPYPRNLDQSANNAADGQWEISTNGSDITVRDDTSTAFVTNNAWYSQALIVSASGGNRNHKFYINLPSTTTVNTITYNQAMTPTTPTPNILIWGQAPDNGTGVQSWGGYGRWEEQNAIIRGVQVYSTALTQAQVVALSAFDYDGEVLSYCTANGITSLWYLNMNWKTSDVQDKSGNAHHMSIRSTNSAQPADWGG